MKIKRKIRAIVVRWLVRFFTSAIRGVITWEMTMAKQEDCKHEGMEGKAFCGDCGKQLRSDEETELDGIVERVLLKHGIVKLKKGKTEEPARTSLADRLKGKK